MPQNPNQTPVEDLYLDSDLLPRYEPDLIDDARLIEPVLNAIQTAVGQRGIVAAAAFAGRFYERKGHEETRAFGEPINKHYDSDDGDFYLKIGVRVPARSAQPVLDAIREIEKITDAQLLEKLSEDLLQSQRQQESAQRQQEDAAKREASIQTEIDKLTKKGQS